MAERMSEEKFEILCRAPLDTSSRDALRAEAIRARESEGILVEALGRVKSWRGIGENHIEVFDRVAQMFRNDTGHFRPGRSVPVAMGGYDEDERHRAWNEWVSRKNDELDRQIVAALAAAGVEVSDG